MLPSSNRVEAAEECMKAQTPTRSDSETVCVESTLLSNLCLRYHQTQHLSSEEIFPCIQDCTTQEVKEIADRMKGANWSSRRAVWSVVDEIPHVWRDWVWPKAVRLEELLVQINKTNPSSTEDTQQIWILTHVKIMYTFSPTSVSCNKWVWVSVYFLNGTSAQEGYLVPFKVYMMDMIWK